ncbi:hypothetical protein IFM89_021339 [Coptis chinensis]|uniref:Carboxypeptidase n=1 Tax=Coptis chinensis TaxID=261450 RepID=A0A835ID14_9MAGN|nr:hypothetical protein IFM89_021339 [Coptis chinensis]
MARQTTFLLATLVLSCSIALVQSNGEEGKTEGKWDNHTEQYKNKPYYVRIEPQDGLKEADRIEKLPGQPKVKFNQYSGYVTVDGEVGRALFYYFVESPDKPSTKPLVLWLNGGPGCSSLGTGAMTELGPFRVEKDGTTLKINQYAWNKKANILFLESPAGVGFSYSNSTLDYELSRDERTAQDSYTFLLNWLERFPEYKNRDFFMIGESYAGHFIPQLAQLILQKNKETNQTRVINLRGITIGNALVDEYFNEKGKQDFLYTHAIISKQLHESILNSSCDVKLLADEQLTAICQTNVKEFKSLTKDVNLYNIYAPSGPLHGVHFSRNTLLPTIKELMTSGIRVWIYSGDLDAVVPFTGTEYAIDALGASLKNDRYAWYNGPDEVGGYVVEYHNLTYVIVRGAGHMVPIDQPVRALTMFTSFLEGKLLPRANLTNTTH